MLGRLFGRQRWRRRNFKNLLENLSEGILVQDEWGKVFYVNTAFAQIFGFESSNDILQFENTNTFFSQFKVKDEDDHLVLPKNMPGRKVFKSAEESRTIIKLKNKKGKEIWVRVRASAIEIEEESAKYSVGIFRDVTERKNTEDQDAIRKTLLEAQGAVSNQGILAVDKNQKVIYANLRLAQMLDMPIEKIENENIEQLFAIGKKTVKDFDKFFNKAHALGKSKTRKGKGTVALKNGRFIDYYTVAIENESDEYLARLWFFEDKTNDYKIEEQRNTFIGIATHELKTPLTTIRGYAEVLKKKLDQKDIRKSRHYVEKIIDNTDKVTELVNDLLDINQVRQGSLKLKKEEFNIDEVINDVLEGFKRLGSHKIHKIGKTRRLVFADKTRIRQVLVNLLSNSVKYSPKGSTVRLSVKQDKLNTTVSVKDSGPGVPDKDKEKIFQIYVRGKGKYRVMGLGIGLFVSQTIVKGHGGKIWVESKVGKGANFIFTIPAKTSTKKESGLVSFFKKI